VEWAGPSPLLEPRKFRGRVLVAEDNPTNQTVIVMRMKGLGCDVDVANDGREAVRAVESESYDLILMDCQMPIMDGLQATREIRRREKGVWIPIVAVTANAMEGERKRCLEAGMDDYISKPIRVPELVKALTYWLGDEAVGDATACGQPRPSIAHAQFEDLLTILKDDGMSRDDIGSMLENFLQITPPVLQDLSDAIERRDKKTACFLGHRVKGSFSMLCLTDLAAATTLLEEACETEDWDLGGARLRTIVNLFQKADGPIRDWIRSGAEEDVAESLLLQS
jgi:CheY-like chemotaxis protein/HPt (histidine-containing phosphotransfer) domain-containing protein